MVTRNASRLDAGLIARKGEAAPAGLPPARQSGQDVVTPPRAAPAAVPADTAQEPAASGRDRGSAVAVTVKLDPDRYQRLRMHGVKVRRTNQAILQEALDAFLARHAE